MYPNSKLNCLAHVAMTIIITVSSTRTTATISHTNTTNATLSATTSSVVAAAAAAVSTDVKTETTVVARTTTTTAAAAAAAAALLRETSTVQLTNSKTTGTGFSISTNSTRVASFTTNITPATAASNTTTTTTTQTTKTKTTTASKNNTFASPTTTTSTHSTKSNTSSPVQETASQTITKPPPPSVKIPIGNTINTKPTSNLSTITDGTSTIISVSNTVTKNSSLLDSIVSKVGDSGRIVYINTSHSEEIEGTGNIGTLHTRRRSVDSLTPKSHALPPEANTSPNGLDTVKNSSSHDTDHTGSQWLSSTTSPSLSSSWLQISPLRRSQLADAEKALPRPEDTRSKKHGTEGGGNYSTPTGIAAVEVRIRTKRSTLLGQGSLTYPKTESLKLWTQLEFPSKTKPHLQTDPSFHKTSAAIKVRRTKQLKFRRDRGKGNSQKDYKLQTDRQQKPNIFHLASYLIDQKRHSKGPSVNRKRLVSALTSTSLDLYPWRVCRFCRWINEQKKWRAFLKSQYRKKRKRRPLSPPVATNATKTEFFHPAKTGQEDLDYTQVTEEIPLSATFSKETDDDVIRRGIELPRTKIDNKLIIRSSQKVPPPLDRGRKESGRFQVMSSQLSKGKLDALIPAENISLVNGDQTESEIHINANYTNNTNMSVLDLSGQNPEDRKSVNTSSDIDTTFPTNDVGDKDHNCNNKKLCSVSRPEPLQRLNPAMLKPPQPLTRTSDKFPEANSTDSHNRISNDDRPQSDSNIIGLPFAKQTQSKSLETGKLKLKKDDQTTTNKTIAGDELTVSVEAKRNSGILLKAFVNKSVRLQNPKQPLVKHSDEKLRSTKELDSLPKENSLEVFDDQTQNKQAMGNMDKEFNSINTDQEDIHLMLETSVQHGVLHEDYTRNHFRDEAKDDEPGHQRRNSETKSAPRFLQRGTFETTTEEKEDPQLDEINRVDVSGEGGGFHENDHQRRILIEKHDDGFTENDATVVDEGEDEDDEKLNENGQRRMFNDDEDEDIWDRPVLPNPFHNRKNIQRRENERKEREYSWLKNAYESISYRQSHDFFLDPQLEQRRLERKVLRRWRSQPRPNWQQGLGTSTHTEHLYLPLQNTHSSRNYPSAISDHEIANALQIESQPPSRIKRSTINLDDKFTEPVGDEDNEKPCGNHGRHRSHVGGMHHLTRHRRRDIHRAPRARHRYPRDVRFPSASQTFSGDAFGQAAYFSGVRELMHLRVKKRMGLAQELIPRQHFTIELWIKPEGGQSNPTIIIGLFDICHQDHKAKGWNIGIRTYEEGQEEDARIYFSLETDRATTPSVLMSDRTYEPNRWVHVAASYTGKKMKLYINTALVGVQHLQTGDIFSASASSCKEIFLGGKPYSKENLYRGSVDQILLWNFPLKHGDVVQNMFDARLNMDREKGIVFKESFHDLSQWKSSLKGQPELHFSNIEDYRYDIQLVAPPCGKTVCDDPDVIRSYVQHSELRQEKKVRYRIVNVMNNNEENPKVTKFQTVAQHRALVTAFKQYNISWELEEVKLRNTSLRHKTVLLDCLPIQIGDKHCNRECQHTQTGNDGGDCDPDEIPCDAINLGNGRCDFECNRAYYEWDRGDCCKSPFKSANSTCLDPDSPHRIYLSMDEYKTALNVNGSTHLNVYLASWSLKGLATFPWEKHVYDVLGGTVVDTNSFGQPGKMDGLIHEFGHNLGLWHVHHGISEVKCDDPCMENEPSLGLGDLCSDTAPTAQNTQCRDPDWTVQACGISPFKNTPYRNYMSYASGNCTNHFTPQQVARMHCYLDLVYQPWQTIMKPSPVPLPPKVVAATLDSVTFVWLPGLGDNVYGSHSECHRCTQDGALIQYASSARAPSDSRKKLHWNKEEALGPPDAERCKASSLSWMQETYECKGKCYIEFMFKYNTVPQSISIWVIWKAAVGIKTVKFYFMDGSTDTIGPIRAFCDMPFTANLNYTKKVKKVRIYPNNTYVGIDAIQLVSTPESARICSSCRPTKYRVMRSPDFPRPVYTSDTMYTDGSVMRGVNYSYTIQVNIGNKVSGPSPALYYQHGQPFCGNGRVETNLGELCDDGNVNDGDGCTADCEVEQFYRCKGTPSLCYRHDGDGICEKDEQNTSLRDCGYHTPEGYEDQWPVSAIGNPRHQLTPKCSEEVLIGAPTRFQVCKNNVELSDTWRPCNTNYFDAHDYWVKVHYARPVIAVGVVIYLGSDGRTYDSPEPKYLLVQLIDTDDRVTYVEHKLVVSCQSNPIYVSILHDLSRSFFRTKGVKLSLSSSNIAIAGIRLRASQHFDPITPESCSQEQFYNPRSQQCVNQTCPRKYCDQLITENANTTCTGRGEGDICQITCLDGYRIRNELDEVICADGIWRRSSEVSCIPVDCGWPAMVHATFICPRGTTFKQTCSFRCNPPAQLQGSGSMVTCEADGRWSMVNAYCLAFCHSPIEHPNAYPTSRSCQIEKAHQAGSRCKFRCEKGYHIEGMPAKRRSLHLTCKESGQWEGTKCVRVTCKKIPPEFTGMYTCSESTYGGSRCILKCNTEPRAQKIKCLQKGVWSAHFKMCNFPKSAKCPTPLLIDHRVQLRNCNNRSAGSTCEVTCNSQAYQPALPHMNGTIFDSKDRIMKLTCTGMLKWLPNPRHISCKGTCRVMSLKDGWCDSSNNRFFCAWDKGDCCASTVEGGKIRLDKPTCKSKCACKDPNAKENTNKSKK